MAAGSAIQRAIPFPLGKMLRIPVPIIGLQFDIGIAKFITHGRAKDLVLDEQADGDLASFVRAYSAGAGATAGSTMARDLARSRPRKSNPRVRQIPKARMK